jgi:hypothetical protein
VKVSIVTTNKRNRSVLSVEEGISISAKEKSPVPQLPVVDFNVAVISGC